MRLEVPSFHHITAVSFITILINNYILFIFLIFDAPIFSLLDSCEPSRGTDRCKCGKEMTKLDCVVHYLLWSLTNWHLSYKECYRIPWLAKASLSWYQTRFYCIILHVLYKYVNFINLSPSLRVEKTIERASASWNSNFDWQTIQQSHASAEISVNETKWLSSNQNLLSPIDLLENHTSTIAIWI